MLCVNGSYLFNLCPRSKTTVPSNKSGALIKLPQRITSNEHIHIFPRTLIIQNTNKEIVHQMKIFETYYVVKIQDNCLLKYKM